MVEAFMGDIGFDKHEVLELGKEYEVWVRFPLVQRIERFMDKERKWWIHEGPQKVGEAEIIGFEMPQGK